jgi:hypothetical protein
MTFGRAKAWRSKAALLRLGRRFLDVFGLREVLDLTVSQAPKFLRRSRRYTTCLDGVLRVA